MSMDSNSDFLVTLVSNGSMDIHPLNKPSRFKNTLPTSYQLESNAWECGLAEIQFTNNFKNVKDDEVYFDLVCIFGGHVRYDVPRVKIAGGVYTDTTSFVGILNKELQKNTALLEEKMKIRTGRLHAAEFQSLSFGSRVKLAITQDAEVYLSPKLREMLQFPDCKIIGPTVVESIHQITLKREDFNIWIYSDVIDYRPVGGVSTPLLRIISQKSYLEKNRYVINKVYQKIHYSNVSTSTLQDIELALTDDNGEDLIFMSGNCIATLHFRRKRY